MQAFSYAPYSDYQGCVRNLQTDRTCFPPSYSICSFPSDFRDLQTGRELTKIGIEAVSFRRGNFGVELLFIISNDSVICFVLCIHKEETTN